MSESIQPNGTGIMSKGRDYIVTLNTWDEVESLGKTVPPETESIYYEEYRAESSGQAKGKFIFNGAFLCEFIDVKCRLRKNVNL